MENEKYKRYSLGGMRDHGDRLFVVCMRPVCSRTVELDIDDLIRKVGPDFVPLHHNLIRRFRFRCRNRNCQGGNHGVSFRHIADQAPEERSKLRFMYQSE